ncbi:MAG TPA: carboxyl transferase domain-containing protein [Gemmatimonadales bacterium]|nr:carboxyl transferase domain-containing protein [Gemmatimonadales bacterium]
MLTTLTGSPVDHRKVVRAQEIAVRCRIPILYHLPDGMPANTPVRILETAAILRRLPGVAQLVITAKGRAEEAGVLGALANETVGSQPEALCSARGKISRPVPRARCPVLPLLEPKLLYSLLPNDHRMPYDMRRLLSAFLDGDGMQEFQPHVAEEMICATARIGGHDIGVMANARGMFRERKTGQPRIGGIIYAETAEKCAYFIETMNQLGIPILFVQDVSGFMLGVDAERSGIIRSGAKFVEAMAVAQVPRLVLTINHASGAGYYAMAAQGFEPDFLLTWPTGRMAAMEGESAVNALFAPQLEELRRADRKPDAALERRIATVRADYERWLDARTAAASGYVDAIVLPEDTRPALILALAAVRENRGSHLLPCRRALEFAI